jgi:lipase chaperone LimK
MRRLSTALALLLASCYAGADELPSEPRSLAGTDLDGDLRAHHGVFVFDDDARRAFDYFLTADGEQTRPELDAWVRSELAARLPANAADHGFMAWQAYVDYRSDAAELLADPTTDLTLAEARLHTLITEQLGDYPIAADEQAQISRAFAVKRALTSDDRELALTEVSAPSLGRDAEQFLTGHRAAALAHSPDELQKIRRDHFGAAAADRLAALDARRDAWNHRVAAFHAASALLPDDEAVAALAHQQFTPTELRRLFALERLAE